MEDKRTGLMVYARDCASPKETEMDNQDSGELLIVDDQVGAGRVPRRLLPDWTILIVDDDHGVHEVTRLVLKDFLFEGRGLAFHSAYTGEAALEFLREHEDTAVILLDVVMETDDAGLRVARATRCELGNTSVRIILRTGQPGQAPESRVIVDYDINDYKAKTELTTRQLFTSVVTALRGFRDLQRIQGSKQGLEKIVRASADLFLLRSLDDFISGVLQQMCSLMPLCEPTLVLGKSRLAATQDKDDVVVLAGTGMYAHYRGHALRDVVTEGVLRQVTAAFHKEETQFRGDAIALFISSKRTQQRLVVYLEGYDAVNAEERELIDLFCASLAIAYDNAQVFDLLVADGNGGLDEGAMEARKLIEQLQDTARRLGTQGDFSALSADQLVLLRELGALLQRVTQCLENAP